MNVYCIERDLDNCSLFVKKEHLDKEHINKFAILKIIDFELISLKDIFFTLFNVQIQRIILLAAEHTAKISIRNLTMDKLNNLSKYFKIYNIEAIDKDIAITIKYKDLT